MDSAQSTVESVVAYHRATKHHFHRFAIGPGRLDWATQPDPFRRYHDAPVVALDREPLERSPRFDAVFERDAVDPAPLDRGSISRLFYDSLALSAWKRLGTVTWALRVNPSSGNLHPTEGYLVTGPVEGLCDDAAVFHYAPKEHALELRTRVAREAWERIAATLPPRAVLVGLTSVHWREAWKYGERAYRYCQHDVGHAIAAVAIAAAGLGWRAALVDGPSTDDLSALLGVGGEGPDAEHPDCLLVVAPDDAGNAALPEDLADLVAGAEWLGRANALSSRHLDWPIISAVADAARKPRTRPARSAAPPPETATRDGRDVALRTIVHGRRSAVAMDGTTWMDRSDFYRMLGRTARSLDRPPLDALWWEPAVHLGLFVHRVRGVDPGLYFLRRGGRPVEWLRRELDGGFDWVRPDGCPDGLELFRLLEGDATHAAAQVSCHQSIAADGCFAVAMLAELGPSLGEHGAWFYPRLYWECGAIGQVLYLEAEAAGVRSTGIGCFFDDPVHALFGVRSEAVQSLYHFTVGGAVEDTRLTTLPAYEER